MLSLVKVGLSAQDAATFHSLSSNLSIESERLQHEINTATMSTCPNLLTSSEPPFPEPEELAAYNDAMATQPQCKSSNGKGKESNSGL